MSKSVRSGILADGKRGFINAIRIRRNSVVRMIIMFSKICLLLLFAIAGLRNELIVTEYTLELSALPEAFDGYTILSIADLHSRRFGEAQGKLIGLIREQQPDMIVFAGDVIHKADRNTVAVQDLLRGIAGIAPLYAVAGNHELEAPALFAELLTLYEQYGVIYLDGESSWIDRDGQYIVLQGEKLLQNLKNDHWIDNNVPPDFPDQFNILLHHFGDEFDQMSDSFDLVLTGHVHGGVIRMFDRGMLSNARGLFPKYDKGVYRKQSGSVMVLSAGLGDTFVPRFFNHRELVKITLKKTRQ